MTIIEHKPQGSPSMPTHEVEVQRQRMRESLHAIPRMHGRGKMFSQLASQAQCSVRTASRWLAGEPVRPSVARSLAFAAKELLAS